MAWHGTILWHGTMSWHDPMSWNGTMSRHDAMWSFAANRHYSPLSLPLFAAKSAAVRSNLPLSPLKEAPINGNLRHTRYKKLKLKSQVNGRYSEAKLQCLIKLRNTLVSQGCPWFLNVFKLLVRLICVCWCVVYLCWIGLYECLCMLYMCCGYPDQDASVFLPNSRTCIKVGCIEI